MSIYDEQKREIAERLPRRSACRHVKTGRTGIICSAPHRYGYAIPAQFRVQVMWDDAPRDRHGNRRLAWVTPGTITLEPDA